jgi:uncharacterized protein YjbI with pentapeptide repeats
LAPPEREEPAPAGSTPELPEYAKKANDLEAIKKGVDDAASVGGGLWLSYLFVLFYLAVAAGAVTHADLFLENPVKLPFLNVELPLLAFFSLAPILFLFVHAYTLVHLVFLTDKAKRFDQALSAQIGDDSLVRKDSDDSRIAAIAGGQLPSNIFIQFLAGPKDRRTGTFGRLLRVIAWSTLAVAPILLLLLFQIQFLPFHNSWITWTHRLALVADLGLLWCLWRMILSRSDSVTPGPAVWVWRGIGAALTAFAILFSLGLATFPGEWQTGPLAALRLIHERDRSGNPIMVSVHDWLFESRVDDTTRRRRWPLSSTLVLPGFNIYEGLGIDDPNKTKWHDIFRARGRDLRGAIFDFATIPRADFTRAQLQGASLSQADLQNVSLDGAHLEGAELGGARLQGASLVSANLQAASLDGAQLQGAKLEYADMRSARLDNAHLQGASLTGAELRAADLTDAQLQGAWLSFAQLQGARLTGTRFEATSLYGAQLQGASLQEAIISAIQLSEAFLWRTNSTAPIIRLGEGHPEVVSLVNPKWGPLWQAPGNSAPIPWDENAYRTLKRTIEPLAPPPNSWDNQMLRVSRLDCASADRALASCDPSVNGPAETETWQTTLENARVDNSAFARAWGQGIEAVVCTGEDNGSFYFAGGRSLRSLEDASLEDSLFALREMTSPNRNHFTPAVPEAPALIYLAPSVVDFIMSTDCRFPHHLLTPTKPGCFTSSMTR